MPAFFLAPYAVGSGDPRAPDLPSTTDPDANFRFCRIAEHTSAVRADGGGWRETEILGDAALVKVRASVATLATIAETFYRFPLVALDDPLSSLNGRQRSDMNAALLSLGFTQSEIDAALNLRTDTFGAVLRFITARDASRPGGWTDETKTAYTLTGAKVRPESADDLDSRG